MKPGILILLIISLLLTACQKETSPDNLDPADISLLKKFVLLDPAQSAPNDTLIVSVYAYDSQNRCTSITSTDKQSGETITTVNNYNGTDTVIQNRKISYPLGEYDWEYFTYNTAGQMIGDSIVSNSGNTLVYKYQVAGSNFDLLLTDFTNSVPVLKGKFEQTKSGNNIIAEKDSGFFYNAFSGNYDFRNESIITISYDGHPNPFYRVYPKRLVNLEYENAALDDFYLYYSIPQSNNVLEEQRSVNPATTGLVTYHNRFTYLYNANGYPSVVDITNLETGELAKGIYIY